MNLKKCFFISLISLLFLGSSYIGKAQTFQLIPLGVHGGGEESNLSAYMLGEVNSNAFIALDAGNLLSGIDKAIETGVFSHSNTYILKNYIKGYFISHGHLDHLAGLIINSPEDSAKNIYGTPYTLDILKTRYFTNSSWINFADKGEKPRLGKYTYKPVEDGAGFKIDGTNLKGQIFELSHGNPYKGSALLVTAPDGDAVLYFGDTGADRIEKSDKLSKIWTAVAPLIKNHRLKAIMIENSYDNTRDETQLFGHLTPGLLNEELKVLAEKSGQKDLKDLKVIITHMKPGEGRIQRIKADWMKFNPLKVKVIFPTQGERIFL